MSVYLPVNTDRGVSSTTGVLILLAITVILGAIIFAFVSGLNLNNTPEVAGVTFEENPDKGTITVDLVNIQKDGTDRVILVGNGEKLGALNDVGDSTDITPPSDGSQITIVAVDDEDGNPRTTIGDYDPSFGGTQVDFSQDSGDLDVTLGSARDSVDNVTVEWEEGGSTQTETISSEGETITISDSNISNDTTVTATEQPSGTVITEYTYTTDGSTTESFSTAHTTAPNCGEVTLSDDDGNGYLDVNNDYKLQCIEEVGLDKDYELTTNINATGTSEWNSGSSAVAGSAASAGSGKGFEPIGNGTYTGNPDNNDAVEPFTGEFRGRGYEIKGLHINRADGNTALVGMFARVNQTTIRNFQMTQTYMKGDGVGVASILADTGSDSNVVVEQVSVEGTIEGTSGTDAGGLGAYFYDAQRIEDVSFSGTVDTQDTSGSGGIVGQYYGGLTIRDVTVDATVSGIERTEGEYLGAGFGGVAGGAFGGGTIENVTVSGTVKGGYDNNGGVVGYLGSDTELKNIESSATVSTDRRAAGLVGGIEGSSNTITNSHATGDISSGSFYAGGLVGEIRGGPNTITDSYATGDVSGGSQTGGLVGETEGSTTIEDSYATGDVSGGVNEVGGLIGGIEASTTIKNSHATGDVSGDGNKVGGLIGETDNSPTITDSYATGDVSGGSGKVGGFVGDTEYITITDSYATGDVTGDNEVGGFAGFIDSPFTQSSLENVSASGTVSGTESVGGLVGDVEGGDFTNSYATGEVSASNAAEVGGFAGEVRESSFDNSYALVNVDATGGNKVGGFVGVSSDDTSYENVYASGTVNGDTNTGGFAGTVDSGDTFTDAYWNSDAASSQSSDTSSGDETGITNLSDSEMTGSDAEANMNFDFTNTWETTDSYPVLQERASATTA